MKTYTNSFFICHTRNCLHTSVHKAFYSSISFEAFLDLYWLCLAIFKFLFLLIFFCRNQLNNWKKNHPFIICSLFFIFTRTQKYFQGRQTQKQSNNSNCSFWIPQEKHRRQNLIYYEVWRVNYDWWNKKNSISILNNIYCMSAWSFVSIKWRN